MIADVVAVGARGPLGLSSLQLALGVRAKKKEPRAIEQRDRFDQEMSVCFVPGLGELQGRRRFEALAAPAFTEAVVSARAKMDLDPSFAMPVVLTLPSPGRPDDEGDLGKELLRGIADKSGLPIDLSKSSVVRKDQPGFAHALLLAAEILAAGSPCVAVGGVDSYYHPKVLEWLDKTFRLASLRATKGFIPAEGAAFIVLCPADSASSDNKLATLRRVDIAQEKSDLDEEEPNVGVALTALLNEASAALGPPSWVINDCNGERHRRTEFDLAHTRTLDYEAKVTSWVDELGDTGAATGALFSAVAIQLWQLNCAHPNEAMITLASEIGDRGLIAWQKDGAQ